MINIQVVDQKKTYNITSLFSFAAPCLLAAASTSTGTVNK